MKGRSWRRSDAARVPGRGKGIGDWKNARSKLRRDEESVMERERRVRVAGRGRPGHKKKPRRPPSAPPHTEARTPRSLVKPPSSPPAAEARTPRPFLTPTP